MSAGAAGYAEKEWNASTVRPLRLLQSTWNSLKPGAIQLVFMDWTTILLYFAYLASTSVSGLPCMPQNSDAKKLLLFHVCLERGSWGLWLRERKSVVSSASNRGSAWLSSVIYFFVTGTKMTVWFCLCALTRLIFCLFCQQHNGERQSWEANGRRVPRRVLPACHRGVHRRPLQLRGRRQRGPLQHLHPGPAALLHGDAPVPPCSHQKRCLSAGTATTYNMVNKSVTIFLDGQVHTVSCLCADELWLTSSLSV